MRRVAAIVIGFCLLGAPLLYAANYLSLEEAINIALKNNPQIKAQDEYVQGRLMEERVSFSNMLPSVDLDYNLQKRNETPTIVLPATPPSTVPMEIPTGFKNTYTFSVSATQPLYAGGALYNAYKVAGNTYRATNLGRDQVVRDLKYQVIEAYYSLIQTRQTLEVAKSASASRKSHMDVANAFFSQGMIPKNDLLEAEVSYAQSQQNLIRAENNTRLAESNLNQLLGRELSVPVVTDREIPMPEITGSLEGMMDTAFKDRQELKVTELQIDSANKGISIVRAGYLPSVGASLAYTKYGDHPNIDYVDAWQLGLGLSWNLFQGGATRYGISRATADRNRLTHILQAQKNQVGLEVKNDYLSAQEAKARVEVAAKAIDQAQENLRIQRDRFNLQVATTTDVLDAQSLLDQARMNYITARSDYAKANAALNAAMGKL